MGNQSSSAAGNEEGNQAVISDNLNTVQLRQAHKQLTVGSHEDNLQGLPMAKFQALFRPYAQLADLLVGTQRCQGTHSCISEEQYVAIGKQVTGLSDLASQSSWLFSLFSQSRETLKTADFQELLKAVCSFTWSYVCEAECADIQESDPSFKAVTKSLFRDKDTVDLASFQQWCSTHAVNLSRGIHIFTVSALLDGKIPSQQCITTEFSEFGQSVLDKCTEVTPAVAWLISATLQSSYMCADVTSRSSSVLPLVGMTSPGGWYQLYSSNFHGLSINRFQHHVFEYKGSTVSFISFERHLYCVAVDQEWSDDTSWWGGMKCCLLQLQPEYKIMQSGSNMVYFNTRSRNAPKCLQIGKTPQTPIIEVNSDFDKVKHFGIEYPLQNFEVWGCSGSSAREAQEAQKRWEQRQADKAKNRKLKIDKDEWKDSPDRQILEMGGVQTEHAER